MRDKEAETFIALKYPDLPTNGFESFDAMADWFENNNISRQFMLYYKYGWIFKGDIACFRANRYNHYYGTIEYIEDLKLDLYRFHNDMLMERLISYG